MVDVSIAVRQVFFSIGIDPCCSSVMRRPSLHEKEKDAMSAKDARDEARHVLEMMAAANRSDEDTDDDEGVQPETKKVFHIVLL